LQELDSSSSSADTAHWQQQHLTAKQDPSCPSSSSSRRGQQSLASLTSLTALSLDNIQYGLSDCLAGLSALKGLQQLLLGAVDPPPPQALHDQEDETQLEAHQIVSMYEKRQQREQRQYRNVVTSLYQLSRLTQLELQHSRGLSQATPDLFAHMQQLQELKLLLATVMSADVLQDLPASVTKFEMWWRGGRLSSSTVPALARLTSLQHFVLSADSSGGFEPSLISSMQQLRVLRLKGVMFSEVQQHGDQAAAAAAAPECRLLDALSQLSKLETLAIISTPKDGEQPPPAHDAAKYSALLSASAHLTQLHLCWDNESWLPVDCWQHVFAAGVQRPQLKELWVGLPKVALEYEGVEELTETIATIAGTAACFGLGDLERLVQCCPALECLSIPGMVDEDEDVTPLAALTALTALFISGEAFTDGVISEVLAPLTQLQRLQIYNAPNMTDQGLLALSALRQLTVLGAWDCGISEALWEDAYDRSVDFETKVRCCCVLLSVSWQSSCILGAMNELQRPHFEWQKQHG
jgi:hypothetical protein